jgi:hypothetical protein
MTIARKPKGKTPVDVDELINKGGTPAAVPAVAGNGNGGREVPVKLRIREGTLRRIDELVAARPVRTARHSWLMEAVVEKLERERFMTAP